MARLGLRLLLQSALDAEITEFLGRERYSRGEKGREGSRNGYCPVTLQATAGAVTLERPKRRGTDEAFASRLLGVGACRTNALESLVIAGFVRGQRCATWRRPWLTPSARKATLSKSTLSRFCEAIKGEFGAWQTRDLSQVTLDYLFLDGSHFKFHAGNASEPVLCAWGITTDGRPVLVGLAPGESESFEAWAEFPHGLLARGLTPPLLVISDRASGLIGAREVVFPTSLRQRCLIHRCRNILAKVPKSAKAEVKAAFWQLFDDVRSGPGQQAVDEVRARIDAFAERFQRLYPAAVTCLLSDVESLTAFLCFPREHWKRIRHSNFIERTFSETRRRVKVIGRLPGERCCLSLLWVVFDRASKNWPGVRVTPVTIRALALMRQHLVESPRTIVPKPKKQPSTDRVTEVAQHR